MFKPTSAQTELFQPRTRLSSRGRERLKSSWAEEFRRHVFPILCAAEPDFADLYDESTGRPTWSIARMLGLLILREQQGLPSDQATVDALAFDARWQHALELGDDDAYLSKRAFTDFRTRLHRCDPDSKRIEKLFERVVAAGLEKLQIRSDKQRIDSTFVRSNMAQRSRRALVTEALHRLVSAARAAGVEVPEEVEAWFTESKHGWDRTAPEALEWLEATLKAAADTTLREHPSFVVAQTVLEEQSVVDDDPDDDPPPSKPSAADAKSTRPKGPRRTPKKKPKNRKGKRRKGKRAMRKKLAADGLKSLHDQDARYGHKGLGYLVTVTETCGNQGSPELITSMAVTPANGSDQAMVTPTLDVLTARGIAPKVLLADAGYTGGDNLLDAAKRGIELRGPVTRIRADDTLNREDFQIAGGRVIACPEGHAPTHHRDRKCNSRSGRSLHALFDRPTCDACPVRSKCPTKIPSRAGDAPALDLDPRSLLRDRRQREQRTAPWREAYALRAGVEASMSELKRAHELGQLTVRGQRRVWRRTLLKGIACNVKRLCRALARSAGDGPSNDVGGPTRSAEGSNARCSARIFHLRALTRTDRVEAESPRSQSAHAAPCLSPSALLLAA